MLKDAEFIVVDESHCARAQTIQTILKYANAPYVLGTSATPTRDEGDDLLIQAELGDIFYHISASTLIEKSWLVQPTIEYYYIYNEPLEFANGQPKPGEEFHAIYRNYIVENEKRNNIICEKAREMVKEGRKVLVLVDYLEAHGKLLEGMLEDINAEFLHAKVSSKKRRNLIHAFRDGLVDCMIATSLADEGLDVPIISGEILAGGRRGKTKVKQRVGRALRPYTGKKDAKVLDFIDDGKFVLEHSIARIASLKSEPLFKILAYNIPNGRKELIQRKIARAIEKNEQRNGPST
jgi:superfamily II DNA or RNA helicase